jgi:hypothetical protein
VQKEFSKVLEIGFEVVKKYIENLKKKWLLQCTNNRTGYWKIKKE